MSQNYNSQILDKQNFIYARERGEIEVLKVKINLITDKIKEYQKIIEKNLENHDQLKR